MSFEQQPATPAPEAKKPIGLMKLARTGENPLQNLKPEELEGIEANIESLEMEPEERSKFHEKVHENTFQELLAEAQEEDAESIKNLRRKLLTPNQMDIPLTEGMSGKRITLSAEAAENLEKQLEERLAQQQKPDDNHPPMPNVA